MFISKHYEQKLWTNHERSSAQDRAFRENQEYILPARFDDTEIPGIRSTTGHISLNKLSPVDFAEIIRTKVKGSSARPGFKVHEIDPLRGRKRVLKIVNQMYWLIIPAIISVILLGLFLLRSNSEVANTTATDDVVGNKDTSASYDSSFEDGVPHYNTPAEKSKKSHQQNKITSIAIDELIDDIRKMNVVHDEYIQGHYDCKSLQKLVKLNSTVSTSLKSLLIQINENDGMPENSGRLRQFEESISMLNWSCYLYEDKKLSETFIT